MGFARCVIGAETATRARGQESKEMIRLKKPSLILKLLNIENLRFYIIKQGKMLSRLQSRHSLFNYGGHKIVHHKITFGAISIEVPHVCWHSLLKNVLVSISRRVFEESPQRFPMSFWTLQCSRSFQLHPWRRELHLLMAAIFRGTWEITQKVYLKYRVICTLHNRIFLWARHENTLKVRVVICSLKTSDFQVGNNPRVNIFCTSATLSKWTKGANGGKVNTMI